MTSLNQFQHSEVYAPSFYRLSNATEKQHFEQLIKIPGVQIFNCMEDQLNELIKTKNPATKYNSDQLKEAATNHIKPYNFDEYGVWVYYPWANRIIHLLDEEEFIEVRTSRNQNKITKAEQEILRKKKIGVIGLSVGQSVSLTLAMERICGELRLADFDTLELNNLNRIRTGLHNIGLPKVYAVAREIAEIDPYISIKCFVNGVTENNLHQFLTEGGNLDLMVEESDGFDIKILSRYKARELKIPVIMEASDRCMVDVERFDLEPNRNILHGLVNHLDLETLKKLKTTEDKIPYMLDVLGLDSASLQLKASMLEIDQTINTWPQLASAVTLGGGITADVSRRLLLNQFTKSGRYHIDLEELIGDNPTPQEFAADNFQFEELTISKMEAVIQAVKEEISGQPVSIELQKLWIEKANLAPSAGNNQPWKWYLLKDNLYLFHDKSKSFSWSDPFDHLAQIGLGAAIENLTLVAMQSGYTSSVKYYPAKNNQLLIAQISFSLANTIINETDLKLANAIGMRCSNRKKGDSGFIEKNILEEISAAAGNDAEIIFVQNRNEIDALAELISTVEKLRFMHPQGHFDFFKKELRWNEKEVLETRDGLDIETLELSNINLTGLRVASDTAVMNKIREWKGGSGLQKISRDVIKTSSAIGLLRISNKVNEIHLKGGQAMQRSWLNATANSIALHPVSSPLFFFERIIVKNDLPDEMTTEILKQKEIFSCIFADNPFQNNLFLFRLSKADPVTKRSLRKQVEHTFVIKN